MDASLAEKSAVATAADLAVQWVVEWVVEWVVDLASTQAVGLEVYLDSRLAAEMAPH